MSYRRPHDAHTRHEHRRDHRHDHRRDSGSYSSSHRSHASDRTSSRKRSIPDSRRISSSVPSKSPRRSHNDSKPRPRSGAETSAKREAQKQYLQKQNRFKRKEACVNLLRQIEFENKLPPIPFRPKFVFNPVVPGGPQGLATYFLPELDYQRNSLEDSKFQFPLLCGADVGCPIDFIDVASLRIPPRKPGDPDPELHPDDAALLQDEQSQLAKMREELAQQHWVQRELISENTVHSNHHHVSQVEREAKALRDAKDREERILRELNARPRAELIEEGFEFANSEDLPPHPTKGEAVKPVRSWPLVPHDGLHGRKYATMHFDHDYAKHCSLPFADAASFGFLLQNVKKKTKKKKIAAAQLRGTFFIPETRTDADDAADQIVTLRTVEAVNIAINTNAADSTNPFLLWWDLADDVVRYSPAQASVILSKAPNTTSAADGTVERVVVHRHGARHVIESTTSAPKPSAAPAPASSNTTQSDDSESDSD